ncbi:MAG: hypothetical protein ACI35P_06590 [Bacillus sp. (in: firmicutes)]
MGNAKRLGLEDIANRLCMDLVATGKAQNEDEAKKLVANGLTELSRRYQQKAATDRTAG